LARAADRERAQPQTKHCLLPVARISNLSAAEPRFGLRRIVALLRRKA